MATKKTMAMAACGVLAAMVASSALAADVAGKLKAYQESSGEATRIMAGMNDAASAKASAERLAAAMTKHRADEAALNAELKKLDLKNPKDGQAMEHATAEITKANETMSAQQMRILQKPEVGEVVGRSFNATPAPARKAK